MRAELNFSASQTFLVYKPRCELRIKGSCTADIRNARSNVQSSEGPSSETERKHDGEGFARSVGLGQLVVFRLRNVSDILGSVKL